MVVPIKPHVDLTESETYTGTGLTQNQVDGRVRALVKNFAEQSETDAQTITALRTLIGGVLQGSQIITNASISGNTIRLIRVNPQTGANLDDIEIMLPSDVAGDGVLNSAALSGNVLTLGTTVGTTYTVDLSSLNVGLTQVQVDARVKAGVLDWAEQGNTSQIPSSKLPSGLATTTQLNTHEADVSGQGHMTAAERTKLTSIEAGATPDQSGTEIRDALQGLNGEERLAASAIKDLPTGGGTADGVADSVDLSVSGSDLTLTVGRSGTLADLTDTVTLPAGGGTADGVVDSVDAAVSGSDLTITLGRTGSLPDLADTVTLPSGGGTGSTSVRSRVGHLDSVTIATATAQLINLTEEAAAGNDYQIEITDDASGMTVSSVKVSGEAIRSKANLSSAPTTYLNSLITSILTTRFDNAGTLTSNSVSRWNILKGTSHSELYIVNVNGSNRANTVEVWKYPRALQGLKGDKGDAGSGVAFGSAAGEVAEWAEGNNTARVPLAKLHGDVIQGIALSDAEFQATKVDGDVDNLTWPSALINPAYSDAAPGNTPGTPSAGTSPNVARGDHDHGITPGTGGTSGWAGVFRGRPQNLVNGSVVATNAASFDGTWFRYQGGSAGTVTFSNPTSTATEYRLLVHNSVSHLLTLSLAGVTSPILALDDIVVLLWDTLNTRWEVIPLSGELNQTSEPPPDLSSYATTAALEAEATTRQETDVALGLRIDGIGIPTPDETLYRFLRERTRVDTRFNMNTTFQYNASNPAGNGFFNPGIPAGELATVHRIEFQVFAGQIAGIELQWRVLVSVNEGVNDRTYEQKLLWWGNPATGLVEASNLTFLRRLGTRNEYITRPFAYRPTASHSEAIFNIASIILAHEQTTVDAEWGQPVVWHVQNESHSEAPPHFQPWEMSQIQHGDGATAVASVTLGMDLEFQMTERLSTGYGMEVTALTRLTAVTTAATHTLRGRALSTDAWTTLATSSPSAIGTSTLTATLTKAQRGFTQFEVEVEAASGQTISSDSQQIFSKIIAVTDDNIPSSNPSDVLAATQRAIAAYVSGQLAGLNLGEDNVQANWNEADSNSDAFIQNKPNIPAGQVPSDWDATQGVSRILNKPSIPNIANSPAAAATNKNYLWNVPAAGTPGWVEDLADTGAITIIGQGNFDVTVVNRFATEANSANITIPTPGAGELWGVIARDEQSSGTFFTFTGIILPSWLTSVDIGTYGGDSGGNKSTRISFGSSQILLGRTSNNKLLVSAGATTIDPMPLVLFKFNQNIGGAGGGTSAPSVSGRVFYLNGQTKRFSENLGAVAALPIVGSGGAGFSRVVFDTTSREEYGSPSFVVDWLTSAEAEASNLDQVGNEVLPANHAFEIETEGVYDIYVELRNRSTNEVHARAMALITRAGSGRDDIVAVDRPNYNGGATPSVIALLETNDQLNVSYSLATRRIAVPATGSTFVVVLATGPQSQRVDGHMIIEKVA